MFNLFSYYILYMLYIYFLEFSLYVFSVIVFSGALFLFCCCTTLINDYSTLLYSALLYSVSSNIWWMSTFEGVSVQTWHQRFTSCLTCLVSYLCSFSSSTSCCGRLQKITTITVTVTNLCRTCVMWITFNPARPPAPFSLHLQLFDATFTLNSVTRSQGNVSRLIFLGF